MSASDVTNIYPIKPEFGARKPLASGGEPPHDGGMEARAAKLEEHVGNLRVDVARIDVKLDGVLANMATKVWILTGALVTVLAILGAVWWMAQQYLAPILHALPK
jgi:hypothetical protein